jgi:transposase
MNVYLAKFMLYFQIHRMRQQGHSVSQISHQLELNRRTVKKYLCMDEAQYEVFLSSQSDRKKILLPFEGFVKERLELYSDTSAAQMHDWLKEHHADFPQVSAKTVFNFVAWVRDKHHLPFVKETRQHQMVEETPYGQQAQVDFGEYNMRTSLGGRIKVYFFSLLLSKSRFKFIWFTDRPFTSELAIQGHEKAFEYIKGVPDEIVYDQDKVFIVSENGGDIILTEAFRAYTREQSFSLHFCRKADPQSKGKVENLVKYVKQNFLYNRIYHNLEVLNEQAIAWLERTANALPHTFTRKVPQAELLLEQPFLKPYQQHVRKDFPLSTYTVRPDNTILYKGSFYSLPLGTYRGRSKETLVALRLENDMILLSDKETKQELCRHKIAATAGMKVANSDHKRDKTAAIQEMIQEVCRLLPDPQKARQWLYMIKKDKPRYIRDQLQIIRATIAKTEPERLAKAVDYCLANSITRATDFRAILSLEEKQKTENKVAYLNPLNGYPTPAAALLEPEKSNIEDYQSIVEKS